MGPTLEHSITVHAGIVPGSRPWSARSLKIPFQHLNRSIQAMHRRGLSIHGMGSGIEHQDQATSPNPVAKSVAAKTATAEPMSKKAGRRTSRRRRG